MVADEVALIVERELTATCRLRRTTQSAVVIELIRGYVGAKVAAKSSYELADELGNVIRMIASCSCGCCWRSS